MVVSLVLLPHLITPFKQSVWMNNFRFLLLLCPCLNAGVLTGHKNCRDKIVRELVPFTASVLLKASKNSDDGNDMEVLLSGVSSE